MAAFPCRGAAGSTGRPAAALEHHVKAAFLYNFTKFAEWPTEAEAADAFVVGVLGSSEIEQALASSLTARSRNGRRFSVRHAETAQDLQGCQVAFIGAADAPRLRALLAALRELPVLTVGDAEGFAARGGVIGFLVREGKLRFEINPAAAARARVRLSSRLLALAVIVGNRES